MRRSFIAGMQMAPLLLSLLFLCICHTINAQNDQQKRKLSAFSADTSKINALIKISTKSMSNGQVNQAMNLAKSAYSYSNRIAYKVGACQSLNLQGRIYYRMASYDSALFFSKKSLILAQDLNDSSFQSNAYLNMGNASYSKGDDILSIDYYFKGLAIEEKLLIHNNLYGYLNNIGGVLVDQKNYLKALEYYLKSKTVAEQKPAVKRFGTIYNNIGALYMKMEKYDSAKYIFEKSYEFAKKENDVYMINLYPSNMAEVYLKMKQYDKAYLFAYKSYNLLKKQGFKDQIPVQLITLGTILMEQNKYTAAEQHLLHALTLSEEIDSKPILKDVYLLLAELYEKKEDFKKTYDYYQLFSNIKDTILNHENSKLITEMNAKYTTEKKEKEIELLKKNEDIQKLELVKKKNELDKQRTVSIGAFAGFLLIMIVAILIFSRYRLKKRANEQLQSAFNLIEEKNKVIEKSNVLITDSITYAKRIQDAILPATEDLTNLLANDFFILYQPAQIVSGDFYWCAAQGERTIFVVADCTGHGVPGAFMSMIGNTLLNEIVNERKVTDTKKIAELLDQKIIHALHQDAGSEKYDGMDISICCIDKEKKEISFTGAHHAMYAFNGQLQKIKGDSYSIGGAQQQHTKIFTSHSISLKKGLCLYFLTDGYCDQSGGISNKRFSSKQFEVLLTEVQGLEMEKQKEKLTLAFESWKGETKQRDDVLVVGIQC